LFYLAAWALDVVTADLAEEDSPLIEEHLGLGIIVRLLFDFSNTSVQRFDTFAGELAVAFRAEIAGEIICKKRFSGNTAARQLSKKVLDNIHRPFPDRADLPFAASKSPSDKKVAVRADTEKFLGISFKLGFEVLRSFLSCLITSRFPERRSIS